MMTRQEALLTLRLERTDWIPIERATYDASIDRRDYHHKPESHETQGWQANGPRQAALFRMTGKEPRDCFGGPSADQEVSAA